MTARVEQKLAAPKPFGARFLAPLLLGSALNPINSSMVATALIGIGTELDVAPGHTAALISVLYLCSAVAQPTLGKLSTVFGPRRTFLGGLAVLFVAGVIGATAPNFGMLLFSRALIGIGTSAAYPTAMALIRRRADDAGVGVPARVIGNLSIAAQITATLGLPLGGILVGVLGWQAIFAINIPLAVIATVLTLIGIPKDAPTAREDRASVLSALDVPGIALFAGAITALLLFLSGLADPVWWQLAVALVLAVGLVIWERRARHPLLDVRMLASNGPLQRTYLRQILAQLVSYTALLGYSQWLEVSRGFDASAVGLIMLPMTGVAAIVARIVSNKGWVRWPLVLAGLVLGSSAVTMFFVGSQTELWVLVLLSVLQGIASGFNGFGNQTALYLQSPPEQIAVASGLLRTSTYLGAIFSSSLIGIVYGDAPSDAGFHLMAIAVLGVGLAIAALAAFDRRIPWTAR